MTQYVAYYRVSTQKQGSSGLGLLAQKNTVKQYIGGNTLLAEYIEIESGKNDKRIELQKAIDYANGNNATLIIAKLDRLSRNAGFIFRLRDSKVDFTCCDIPDANTMTIGIFALIAQQEREMISERTKKALKAKKAQGFVLGKPENLTAEARLKSIQARKEKAATNDDNKKAFALADSMRKQNISYDNIARKLNESGFKTSTGKTFFAMSVWQLYGRMTAEREL
jgi:Site-specific recombinases, DNA invertase Pin homologs